MITLLQKYIELETLKSFSGTIFYREFYELIYEGEV